MRLFLRIGAMSKFILIGILIMGLFANCDWFDSNRQPAISIDVENKQLFSDDTIFPYIAAREREEFILNSSPKIAIGMTGDEAFQFLKAPDQIEILAFPLSDPYGWSWDYNILKVYRYAPAESDRYLRLIFDKSGKISKVVRQKLSVEPIEIGQEKR